MDEFKNEVLYKNVGSEMFDTLVAIPIIVANAIDTSISNHHNKGEYKTKDLIEALVKVDNGVRNLVTSIPDLPDYRHDELKDNLFALLRLVYDEENISFGRTVGKKEALDMMVTGSGVHRAEIIHALDTLIYTVLKNVSPVSVEFLVNDEVSPFASYGELLATYGINIDAHTMRLDIESDSYIRYNRALLDITSINNSFRNIIIYR